MSCSNQNDLLEDRSINLKSFLVDELFAQPPKAASTYDLSLPEECQGVQEFLGYFLTLAAKQIYQRQLGALSVDELEHLRKYLRSIGWDAQYQVETREQTFEHTQRTVNYYLIDFIKI